MATMATSSEQQQMLVTAINYGWHLRGAQLAAGENEAATLLGRSLTNWGIDTKSFRPGGAQGLNPLMVPSTPQARVSGGPRHRNRGRSRPATAATK